MIDSRRDNRTQDDAATRFTILVLGGYGVFGRRICRLLARDVGLRLIVAGRSGAKAEMCARGLSAEFPDATFEPFACTVPVGVAAALETTGAALAIHCVGPFQDQDYRVAEACIARRVDYIDLADGRGFVQGFAALDERAREAGVLLITGASSVPGLSSTVVDRLIPEFGKVEHISIGITPGNRVRMGKAVVEAMLSYAGRPVRVWRDGAWIKGYGWQGLTRRRIAGPGVVPIPPRWLALCDVPDLGLFPKRYPGASTVTFHAGFELRFLQLGFWMLTWLPRLGLVRSLRPFAGPLDAIYAAFRSLGSDRGGMFVEIDGSGNDGNPLRRTWTLVAERGDGPYVPTIPAVILARRIARGAINRTGALPCLGLITLEEFAEATADLAIATAVA